jgi:hypothetical protein
MPKFALQMYNGIKWKFISEGFVLGTPVPKLMNGFDAYKLMVKLKKTNKTSSFRILRRNLDDEWMVWALHEGEKEGICWQKYGF